MTDTKPILVTSALPYANGPIHFGHIAGAYLPADCFVRYHKLQKHNIVYICGTDEYGIAVRISAEKANRSPKAHVDHYHKVISDIFKKFNIEFDHFSRTTNPYHSALSQKFFMELHENGHIEKKDTSQLYCKHCEKYLADRYIQGTCYICGHESARGDECPKCGEWTDALKLKNPVCKICFNSPEPRTTTHWYLQLDHFKDQLKSWYEKHPGWKPNVINFVSKQIESLESRPITRDSDWGVDLPLKDTAGKVLYVWFDAPIGYIDATMEWAQSINQPEKWREYWQNPECRIVNFIGKDNIPFHLIVWPAMLMGQTTSYTLATDIPANEFYNLEGRQFSKSDGWYVELDDFFSKYTPDQIRYAIAANAPETKDSDFNWNDFQKYCNADLANVVGNLVHRVMTFTHKYFNGQVPLSQPGDNTPVNTLKQLIHDKKKILSELYDSYQLRKAAYEMIDLARAGNKFFDDQKPWVLIKEDKGQCQNVISALFDLIFEFSIVSWPLIPDTSNEILKQLGITSTAVDLGWNNPFHFKKDHSLGKPSVLFNKIENAQIDSEISRLNSALSQVVRNEAQEPMSHITKLKPDIDIDAFQQLDLRVAEIIHAESIKGSKKLLKLMVDIGLEKRQILSGIAKYYKPEELIGKKVIVIANLAPKEMFGEKSEGMILAGSIESAMELPTLNFLKNGAQIS